MTYYSHKNVLLITHLEKVSKLMYKHIKTSRVSHKVVEDKIFYDIANLIGLFHDFGKFTSFFQKKLAYSIKGLTLDSENKKYSTHSCLSAIMGFLIIKEYVTNLKKKRKYEPLYLEVLLIIGYIVIRRHHSNLKNFSFELNSEEPGHYTEWGVVHKQASNILNDNAKLDYIIHFYNSKLGQLLNYIPESLRPDYFGLLLKKSLSQLSDQQGSIIIIKKCIIEMRGIYLRYDRSIFNNFEGSSLFFYIFTQYFFSLLIDSDKLIAGDIEEESLARVEFPENMILQYKNEIFGTPKNGTINELRETFFKEVMSFVGQIDLTSKKKIFELTAPTGIGKTITVLSFALKLRKMILNQDKHKEDKIVPPRILYFLPFTSIIDQNYEVIKDIFSNAIQDYNSIEDQFFIKHHHLSEIKFKTLNEEVSNEKALLMIESWNSEMIISTFYQLFHTIFGYRNVDLKKFHKFSNSIIILDEIQSFPPIYWSAFRLCLRALTDFFNCYIILLTATQPKIFNPNETLKVLKKPKYYFENTLLNRISFTFDLLQQKIYYKLDSALQISEKKSYIFVFNTIRSSIETLKFLKTKFNTRLISIEQFEEERETEFGMEKYYDKAKIASLQNKHILLYLSSNIYPKMRRERIKFVKSLNNVPYILVTTQLIEAGVDIDADMIIRDFGPLDSLIQIAGRCNRNCKKGRGEVQVYQFINERNRPYSDFIYDSNLLNTTKTILEENQKTFPLPWSESEFFKLSQEYFKNLDVPIQTITKKYVKILQKLHYTNVSKKPPLKINSLQDFKIIREDYKKIEVFINYDGVSQYYLKQYFKILEEMKDQSHRQFYFKKRIELKNIKRKMQEYTISIPERYKKLFTQCTTTDNKYSLIIPKKEMVNSIYDSLIGFNDSNQD